MVMCRWMITTLFLLTTSDLSLFAQGEAQSYQKAAQDFRSHTRGDFLHDDSKDGINALARMWKADAQAAVEALATKPNATAGDLNLTLCELSSSAGDCGEKEGASNSVVAIDSHLFLASQFSGEAGTVFIVGNRPGRPRVVWSIFDDGR